VAGNFEAGFALGHAAAEGAAASLWGRLTADCVAQLGPMADQAELGFVYVTDPLVAHLGEITALLRQSTGVKTWVGSVGIGILATGTEYFDRPALAVMVAALLSGSWHVLKDGTVPPAARPWIQHADPMAGPVFGVVHADPRSPDLPDAVAQLAGEAGGFLVGGLPSSRGALDQVAGTIVRGGISGVLFQPGLGIATGLSQGCSPIGPVRAVTAAQQNVLFELDGRPALDVFKEDIGEVLARRLERVAGYIHAAFPVAGSDTGDYLVRNLIGIDVDRGWLAVGEQVAVGDRLLFVRRDRQAAEEDLVRMLQRVKRGCTRPPRGGLYFSCVARGPNLFGPDSAELRIVRRELGDIPLVGMFCNGEISNNRLYGYTGVLALFV
jgi:small ligand-binding sensory domain FIST